MLEIITSRSNGLITETAKLKDKKYREEKKAFLFEGIKLTREAIAHGVEFINIFLTEKCAKKYPDLAMRKDALLVSESVCMKISENSAPEGIVCTAKYIDRLHKNGLPSEDSDLSTACLMLQTVQDPGNLGTIARTSAAFGKKTLILSKDCADVYNQKSIRASMGALFRMTTYRADDLQRAIEEIKNRGRKVYATALTPKATPLSRTEGVKDALFVLGNEGHGLDGKTIESCSGTVIIPMEKDAESLNVAAAATVILWEAYR